MDFDVLKKELAEHKVYTAWQFIENTNANIRVAQYCLDTITAISAKMTEDARKNTEEISEKIINHKSVAITDADLPDFLIDIAGNDVDGFFLIQKLIRMYFNSRHRKATSPAGFFLFIRHFRQPKKNGGKFGGFKEKE